MIRALAVALSLLLTLATAPSASARPIVTCERQAKGAFGMITASAVISADTGALSYVYAIWHADGLKPDSSVGLSISYFGEGTGDPWDLRRRNVMVSYDGRRPAQSLWASVTLDDGDSRIARASGIGAEYDDEGDRYADFQPEFVAKVLKQPHVTVEVASADGTVVGKAEIDLRHAEAGAARAELLTGLKDDVAHYKERCVRPS